MHECSNARMGKREIDGDLLRLEIQAVKSKWKNLFLLCFSTFVARIITKLQTLFLDTMDAIRLSSCKHGWHPLRKYEKYSN